MPLGANGTQIFGNVGDIDGGGAFSWSNETFTVSNAGVYYFTIRGVEGGGGEQPRLGVGRGARGPTSTGNGHVPATGMGSA